MSSNAKELEDALADPGFTPGRKHFRPLLDVVVSSDEELARSAARAIARAQNDVGPALLRRFESATSEEQRALVRLAGRLAAFPVHTNIALILERSILSDDVRVRRAAVNAIGRARIEGGEALLLQALEREKDATVRPRLIEALGKLGGPGASAAIEREEAAPRNGAVAFETARAALMVSRTNLRAETSSVRTDLAIGPVTVALRCREGLEQILVSELEGRVKRVIASESFGPGCVDLSFEGPLQELFDARTFLRFGLATPPAVIAADGDVERAMVDALTSPPTLSLLRRLTIGPIRYRIGFGGGGKRRRLVWDTALEVARRAPDLVNDPTDSAWEAVVIESARGVMRVELVPNVDDPRFAYRIADVPAASHPTIAAALVRVAGVRESDVVWDPFVGSGLELAERSIVGPYRELIGTDIDTRALEVARANLDGAGAQCALYRADALTFEPPGALSLIITNPPMGRRVLRGEPVVDLLVRFLRRSATLLSDNGRLVWMSPAPRETRQVCLAAGLNLVHANPVDLGGLDVELQHWSRPPRAPVHR